MPKISISVPNDILEFVDQLGENRSGAIVAILQDFKNRHENEELERAYAAYAELYDDEDALWEQAAVHDVGEEL